MRCFSFLPRLPDHLSSIIQVRADPQASQAHPLGDAVMPNERIKRHRGVCIDRHNDLDVYPHRVYIRADSKFVVQGWIRIGKTRQSRRGELCGRLTICKLLLNSEGFSI